MARTPIQIEDAMIAGTAIIDPGIDASKGPHRSAFIQPQAQVLSQIEQLVDDMDLRYSLRYVQTRNPNVMDLYVFNHGLSAGQGSPSKTTLYFYTFVQPAPGGYVFIPAGTVVSSADNTVSFQTTEDFNVSSDAFPLYYNSTNRRYEFPIPAASIGIGPEFEIAARRLVNLQTPIEGISGVYQPSRTGPSSQVEQAAQLGQRQQAKFVGLALGTPAGLESTIRNFDPANILDVGVVYSTEFDIFRRPLNRPGFDIYLVGSTIGTFTETFRSGGGQTKFLLSKTPCLSLSTVVVNGEVVSAQLVRDTQPATAGSARAADYVQLQSSVDPGSTIQVSYSYNKLITDTSDFITSANKRYWEADILIRTANQIPVAVTVNASALSTVDTQSITNSIQAATFTYVNRNLLNLTLYPSQLRSAVMVNVVGFVSEYGTMTGALMMKSVVGIERSRASYTP